MTNSRVIFLLMLCLFFQDLKGKTKRTNFIQILTDDQGWGDLKSYGHIFLKTPHIDNLAEEGIKLTNCYSAHSVCSPSRAAILTGRTPYRNGVFTWIPPKHYCFLPKEEVTLPQLLRKNGYQTAHFGKWHLSYYSEAKTKVKGHYKDFKLGTTNQPTMKEYGYDYWFATGNVARPNHKDPENFFLNGKKMGKMKGYSAQIVANEFIKWMDNNLDMDTPFFVTIWFHEPHGPINSDPQYIKRYSQIKDKSYQQYLANITQIDEAVGKIVNTLKKHKAFDNTFIWYTSDNGPEGKDGYGTFNNSDNIYGKERYRGSTGGLRGRKRHTHEGGIRVPGIISWPEGIRNHKITAGTLSAEPVIGSDIFPTFLDIAGISLPKHRVIDGASIMPIFNGKDIHRKETIYWRNNNYEYRIAIRIDNWKLLSNSQRTKFQLYNLDLDPRETTDLSMKYPKKFTKMKKILIKKDIEVLNEGPTWWNRNNQVKEVMPK
ncbi:sulfatase-like hydrolase/transferase [Halosquirtibacter xylanolyticus]|uniref:sulfatase family protein n=1 Tax=Halosquirtibacter xylanolyticus TaxID=3374599 RepID=UPI0037493C98|nr:sulfatase-like hydrolase/transferase [Prolixibacteraceae bacterium]